MISYDFHIHSCLSPCGDMEMTPNNIVNMAKLIGLDVIAVSDHNSIGNVEPCIKVSETAQIKVIPAMEVETSEAVHVLTLFSNLERARAVSDIVYNALPDIKNKPELFGDQAYMDEHDNILGYEEKLLISSTSIGFDELFYMVKDAGGIFIPAHVDRHSYSVLMNLGFIPEHLPISMIEISKNVKDTKQYISNRPDIVKYSVLRNSDAHYLQDISKNILDIENILDLF